MMILERGTSTEIALNVTRTRVTVLVFNLTIIALILSIKAARDTAVDQDGVPHLTSSVALFIGFCLTLLGLFWLLVSQNLDRRGMSRPWPFTVGSMTTYLALSQTVTAFMHEYLVGVILAVEASQPGVAESSATSVGLGALDDTTLLILAVMGGSIWVVTTYAGPLIASLKSPVRGGLRWVFAAYYLALQIPIYWVYATAWRLEYVPEDQSSNMLSLFALQLIQPLFWFR